MKRRSRKHGWNLVLAVAFLLAVSMPASAATIALWDYNSYTADNNTSSTYKATPQNPTVTSGAGTQVQVFVGGTALNGWGYNDGGFPSTSTWAGDYPTDPAVHEADIRYRFSYDNANEGLQWNVSTVGYTGIMVSLGVFTGQTLTNKTFSFEYTTDGTNWTNNSVSYSGGSTWLPLTIDLTGVAAANNNSNFAFRFLTDQTGTGTISVDYVNFTGVPIPAAAWLLGTGLIGLVGLRRKFKR